jgi:hypothetical protein
VLLTFPPSDNIVAVISLIQTGHFYLVTALIPKVHPNHEERAWSDRIFSIMNFIHFFVAIIIPKF